MFLQSCTMKKTSSLLLVADAGISKWLSLSIDELKFEPSFKLTQFQVDHNLSVK